MARLISYPILSTVASEDLLPITDISDPRGPLKNVKLSTLQSYIVEGMVEGEGTTNTLPIWTDGANGVLGDSQIIQTKVDGGTIFNLNAIASAAYTPGIGTKLMDLNSSGVPKFSITQEGGGGVLLPSGDILNPGPSFNMGGTAFANGENALALGASTTAFGKGSLAANFITLASGGGASAFGLLTEAAGLASASFGNKTTASGDYSIASGQDSIAFGQSSVAIGEKGDANGKNSLVGGFDCTASGNNSVAFGSLTESQALNSFSIGQGNTSSGVSSSSFGNGNEIQNTADNAIVGGKNSVVGGKQGFSFGSGNAVSSNDSMIIGSRNTVTTSSFESVLLGSDNTTNSKTQVKSLGDGLTGASNQGVYLGKYNDNTDSYNKFQIGNGTSLASKSNSLSINAAGNVKLPTYGSGTVTGTAAYGLSVTANGQIIETTATAPDYLSFVCLLSQSGASNPQPDLVLENSLGVASPFTAFTRVASGEYNLSAVGKFKLLKTIVFINGGSAENNHDVAWEVIDNDNLRIRTHNSDGKLTKAALEIRTYN